MARHDEFYRHQFPRLSPIEWESRLLEIPEEVRQTAGRIICWNCSGSYVRTPMARTDKRTPDDWVAMWSKYGQFDPHPAAEEDLIPALVMLGLDEAFAEKLVWGKDKSFSKHYMRRKTDAQRERNKMRMREKRLAERS